MTGAAASSSFIIDLSYLNSSSILQNYAIDGKSYTVVAYQGGCTWEQVYNTTKGSGFTAVGARLGTVGVGGFSTGGVIGFLAGAHGYAIDRLRAMEVVLMNGSTVMATATNQYNDLFWALQGGGGQFGIVTTFYQEAVPEPAISELAAWVITNCTVEEALARANTESWFKSNTDPYSLMYFVRGVLPADPANLDPSTFGLRTALIALRFQRSDGVAQPTFNTTFTPLISGLTWTGRLTASIPFADVYELLDPFFPYGYRRGFYGGQITNVTSAYLGTVSTVFDGYVPGIVLNGEASASALWALQYMHPGLNGNVPSSDSATAWPHHVAGHQTLFSPAWQKPADDATTLTVTALFNTLTHTQQAANGVTIADYPNYISPDSTATSVWGANVPRLNSIKQKYDPNCQIHQGRVFASWGCLQRGYANLLT